MPIFKKIKSFFRITLGIGKHKLIDPKDHHPQREHFYEIARELQEKFKLTQKQAIKRAKIGIETRNITTELVDKGIDPKKAEKYAKRITKVKAAEYTPIDKEIIEAHYP